MFFLRILRSYRPENNSAIIIIITVFLLEFHFFISIGTVGLISDMTGRVLDANLESVLVCKWDKGRSTNAPT